MQFKAGHVGMLSQVKYFMGDITSKSTFVNVTKFQGSNDNSSYTDLFTVDENIHEGWNYYAWETSTSYPKYRYFRFYGNSSGACVINEVKFTGVETVDSSASSYSCSPVLSLNGTQTSLTASASYQGSITANLTSMSPRFGSVEGGASVTFTGTSFSSSTAAYTITIDGIACSVTAATSTSVTCTTGQRPGLVSSSLEIFISGQGLVSTGGKIFRYVSPWSADSTWGGEFAPMEGESVYVPAGLNLLVDVDRTPVLNLVYVEGSITFAPNETSSTHQRYFDANYIFVNKGTMEVGTEEYPYTSKLTITMHGNVSSPYIPTYGNKVLALRYGTLDMHGPVRTPTWTALDSTAAAGSTTITLHEAVDWVVGEQIAIAATSYNGREGEQRTILAIDRTTTSRPVLTLDQPLAYKHFAATETVGTQGEFIEMRAEVGLLSRNVVFRGDPETTSANQYGANIFMHSQGDDSFIGRLSYVELTDVGQAFKVGRYAIHFHMAGAVHKSYVKGVAVHQGFNRAFTIHGTHYLRVTENVAFEVMGHTLFIEDAAETKNYIYKNLIMKTMRSWSLLNTDQTPACFWITHPDNNFIDNHAAGSDRYGYWYDLQTHSIGPSANTDVCPENDRVGEFRGNHAHSCGRYGLRIFHNMVPRTYPCQAISYDVNNTADPFWQNPLITANFYDLTSWKNGRNGAIAERVGDVRFHNFKTADNILAGIEFSLTHETGDVRAQISNALIIGKTSNTDDRLEWASPHGIITPRTEDFSVSGARFYNFNWNDAALLGSCSHCFHSAATDSGARTVTFSNITWDAASVTRLIRYQYPERAIYYDADGTLTGKGAGSWATPFFQHHNWTGECEHNLAYWGGTFCDNTVQLRRVAFHAWQPAGLLDNMAMKVLQYDDSIVQSWGAIDNYTNLANYTGNVSAHGSVFFKPKLDPAGWAFPLVTGHKYKIHWGITGLDFEQMSLTLSERWQSTDKSLYLVHNFTDVREAINITVNGYLIDNNTIPSDSNSYMIGQNVVYNDTATRELHLVVNGKNKTSTHPHYE